MLTQANQRPHSGIFIIPHLSEIVTEHRKRSRVLFFFNLLQFNAIYGTIKCIYYLKGMVL